MRNYVKLFGKMFITRTSLLNFENRQVKTTTIKHKYLARINCREVSIFHAILDSARITSAVSETVNSF